MRALIVVRGVEISVLGAGCCDSFSLDFLSFHSLFWPFLGLCFILRFMWLPIHPPAPSARPPLTHSDEHQQACPHPGDLGPLSGWFNILMVRLWAISHCGHFLIPDIW